MRRHTYGFRHWRWREIIRNTHRGKDITRFACTGESMMYYSKKIVPGRKSILYVIGNIFRQHWNWSWKSIPLWETVFGTPAFVSMSSASKPISCLAKPIFGRDELSNLIFNVPKRNLRPIQINIYYIAKIPLGNWNRLIGSHPPAPCPQGFPRCTILISGNVNWRMWRQVSMASLHI